MIDTVLTRRGLTPRSLLPISLVLATLGQRYVAGLIAYRHLGDPGDPPAQEAVAAWIDVFLDATLVAAEQAASFRDEIDQLRHSWDARLAAWRESQGRRSSPRSDSVAARMLALLPEMPLLTTRTVQRVPGVSAPVARAGLDELADAGLLTRRTVEQNTTGYLATGRSTSSVSRNDSWRPPGGTPDSRAEPTGARDATVRRRVTVSRDPFRAATSPFRGLS